MLTTCSTGRASARCHRHERIRLHRRSAPARTARGTPVSLPSAQPYPVCITVRQDDLRGCVNLLNRLGVCDVRELSPRTRSKQVAYVLASVLRSGGAKATLRESTLHNVCSQLGVRPSADDSYAELVVKLGGPSPKQARAPLPAH